MYTVSRQDADTTRRAEIPKTLLGVLKTGISPQQLHLLPIESEHGSENSYPIEFICYNNPVTSFSLVKRCALVVKTSLSHHTLWLMFGVHMDYYLRDLISTLPFLEEEL